MPRRTNWEIYENFVGRAAQAHPLTAQELDLRNFFKRYKVKFWCHPVWKVPEDQCFYVYDFAFRFTPATESNATNSQPPLKPLFSPDPDLWLLECSYTTAKPGAAKKFLRKRCPIFDHKFRAAKRIGVNTVLLVEALHVPPQVLSKSLTTLEHVDLLFTAVEAFKRWVLTQLERNDVGQEPTALMTPEQSKQKQVQLNGLLEGM